MNIGILTYHFVSNFGANLQTLSTFSYLKNSEHTPIIIDWVPYDLENYYNLKVSPSQNEAFKSFQQHYYLNKTVTCRTSEDIARVIDEYNIEHVIIGSDAVLTFVPFLQRFVITRRGPRYYTPLKDSQFPNPFWGDFIPLLNKPIKLSLMSASAQNTRYQLIISNCLKKRITSALQRFSYISVRDIWTQNMINHLTRGTIKSIITPDPVFSFNQNVGDLHNKKYIMEKYNLPEHYVLFSTTQQQFLGSWVIELAKIFSNHGIKLIELPIANMSYNEHCIEHISQAIPPDDWYCLIKYATGYIGELMHPILVSLHNGTPIYAIDTYGFINHGKFDYTSSKTYQILQNFNLTDNWFSTHIKQNTPTPNEVFSKIIKFNRELCLQHASRKQHEYNLMMKDILK